MDQSIGTAEFSIRARLNELDADLQTADQKVKSWSSKVEKNGLRIPILAVIEDSAIDESIKKHSKKAHKVPVSVDLTDFDSKITRTDSKFSSHKVIRVDADTTAAEQKIQALIDKLQRNINAFGSQIGQKGQEQLAGPTEIAKGQPGFASQAARVAIAGGAGAAAGVGTAGALNTLQGIATAGMQAGVSVLRTTPPLALPGLAIGGTIAAGRAVGSALAGSGHVLGAIGSGIGQVAGIAASAALPIAGTLAGAMVASEVMHAVTQPEVAPDNRPEVYSYSAGEATNCPKCGKPNVPGSTYCSSCKKDLRPFMSRTGARRAVRAVVKTLWAGAKGANYVADKVKDGLAYLAGEKKPLSPRQQMMEHLGNINKNLEAMPNQLFEMMGAHFGVQTQNINQHVTKEIDRFFPQGSEDEVTSVDPSMAFVPKEQEQPQPKPPKPPGFFATVKRKMFGQCPNCGATNRKNGSKCYQCGKPVVTAEVKKKRRTAKEVAEERAAGIVPPVYSEFTPVTPAISPPVVPQQMPGQTPPVVAPINQRNALEGAVGPTITETQPIAPINQRDALEGAVGKTITGTQPTVRQDEEVPPTLTDEEKNDLLAPLDFSEENQQRILAEPEGAEPLTPSHVAKPKAQPISKTVHGTSPVAQPLTETPPVITEDERKELLKELNFIEPTVPMTETRSQVSADQAALENVREQMFGKPQVPGQTTSKEITPTLPMVPPATKWLSIGPETPVQPPSVQQAIDEAEAQHDEAISSRGPKYYRPNPHRRHRLSADINPESTMFGGQSALEGSYGGESTYDIAKNASPQRQAQLATMQLLSIAEHGVKSGTYQDKTPDQAMKSFGQAINDAKDQLQKFGKVSAETADKVVGLARVGSPEKSKQIDKLAEAMNSNVQRSATQVIREKVRGAVDRIRGWFGGGQTADSSSGGEGGGGGDGGSPMAAGSPEGGGGGLADMMIRGRLGMEMVGKLIGKVPAPVAVGAAAALYGANEHLKGFGQYSMYNYQQGLAGQYGTLNDQLQMQASDSMQRLQARYTMGGVVASGLNYTWAKTAGKYLGWGSDKSWSEQNQENVESAMKQQSAFRKFDIGRNNQYRDIDRGFAARSSAEVLDPYQGKLIGSENAMQADIRARNATVEKMVQEQYSTGDIEKYKNEENIKISKSNQERVAAINQVSQQQNTVNFYSAEAQNIRAKSYFGGTPEKGINAEFDAQQKILEETKKQRFEGLTSTDKETYAKAYKAYSEEKTLIENQRQVALDQLHTQQGESIHGMQAMTAGINLRLDGKPIQAIEEEDRLTRPLIIANAVKTLGATYQETVPDTLWGPNGTRVVTYDRAKEMNKAMDAEKKMKIESIVFNRAMQYGQVITQSASVAAQLNRQPLLAQQLQIRGETELAKRAAELSGSKEAVDAVVNFGYGREKLAKQQYNIQMNAADYRVGGALTATKYINADKPLQAELEQIRANAIAEIESNPDKSERGLALMDKRTELAKAQIDTTIHRLDLQDRNRRGRQIGSLMAFSGMYGMVPDENEGDIRDKAEQDKKDLDKKNKEGKPGAFDFGGIFGANENSLFSGMNKAISGMFGAESPSEESKQQTQYLQQVKEGIDSIKTMLQQAMG